MGNKPVFSIITLAYDRLAYSKESLGAMLRQTYPYIEIIIVDNGAIPEVYEFITELERKDSRVKIVHFKENQYRDDGFENLIKVCFNTGLKAATGEFVWYQSDDDLIADDYVEKMVALFESNPACTSAAGYVKSIDASGVLLPEGARMSNYRPRYMPGHLLALSTLDRFSPNIMFSAPGSIFVFRREEFMRLGGYHTLIERSHMFGVVPFGTTGFDETAVLYWRRHEAQLNKYMNKKGFSGAKATLALLRDWDIEKRWEIFGKGVARYVAKNLYRNACEEDTSAFVINLYFFRFKACWCFLKELWHNRYFWQKLPFILLEEKRQFKYFLKPYIRGMFESWIWLGNVPGLSGLKEKAFK